MDLSQLQRAFQQHVLSGDDSISPEINDAHAVSAAKRLDVYADAYRLRLIDALTANYPRLQQLVGAEAFGSLAQTYLHAHPSTQPSVRWFGEYLAAHLQAAHPDQPVLRELAQWEWAIASAFDAQDAEPLTEQALSTIDPAAWPTLQLQTHPSVQVLSLTTNVPAVFKALSQDLEPPEPMTLTQPRSWVIWRQDLASMYRSVNEDEAAALQRLAARCTFEELCETLCAWHDPQDVPARAVILLKGWIRDEMVARG